ncbi:MAG: hypothetical protein LBV34_09950, partial [Nocardiopsaceae bacterium]|nr:hypothetical protein [Nocardiopsaceae bacterium]
MAKHKRLRNARTPGAPRGRAAIIRGGTLAVTVALCLAGSLRLFAWASNVADGAPSASLRGSLHARLIPSPMKRHLHRISRRRAGHFAAGSLRRAVLARQGPGRSVTAVGDSIMVASAPALETALPGIYIDAAVGRQFSTGLQVIAGLKSQGLLRPIVVVGLGTNGPVTAGQISQLFADIGPHRKLVLVNTFENRPWEQEVNAILAAAAGEHSGVVLADWHATVDRRTNLL